MQSRHLPALIVSVWLANPAQALIAPVNGFSVSPGDSIEAVVASPLAAPDAPRPWASRPSTV